MRALGAAQLHQTKMSLDEAEGGQESVSHLKIVSFDEPQLL